MAEILPVYSAHSPIALLHCGVLENTGDFKSIFRGKTAKSFFQQGERLEVRRQELCNMPQNKPPGITGIKEENPLPSLELFPREELCWYCLVRLTRSHFALYALSAFDTFHSTLGAQLLCFNEVCKHTQSLKSC